MKKGNTEMSAPIIRYFENDHLKPGPLKETSDKFKNLAYELDSELPDGAEKSTALRKLQESKDSAVRAALDL